VPWLEAELDIVHLSAGRLSSISGDTSQSDDVGAFYHGAEPSWYTLALGKDVQRDLRERLEPQIRSDLRGRNVTRVNLYHAPGAGGSTLARRILWNLHSEYTAAVLKHVVPQESAERIYRITSLTDLPVLLLVDGSVIAEREIDDLYEEVRSRNIPVVLLLVLRRFQPVNPGDRRYYLPATLESWEANWFSEAYAQEVPEKSDVLNSLAHSSEDRFRTAFYFGLHAFEENFKGIEPYVAARIEGASSSHRRMGPVNCILFGSVDAPKLGIKKEILDAIEADQARDVSPRGTLPRLAADPESLLR